MVDVNGEGLTLAQRILLCATELISDEERWCKGSLFKENRYCMLGAIYKAAEEHGEDMASKWYARGVTGEVVRAVAAQVPNQRYSSEPSTNIHKYNDAMETTHKDVKRVFCNAVKEELGHDPTSDSGTTT